MANAILPVSIDRFGLLMRSLSDRFPLAEPADLIGRRTIGHAIARHFLAMRAGLPFAEHIRTTLRGAEHISTSLAQGCGAILWDSQFRYANVATKMAVARAGFDLVHLSSPGHGVSDTAFGRRLLNPIWVAAERKYLAERIIAQPGSRDRSLGLLSKRLKQNALLSISVRAASAQPITVPFLGRHLLVGPGAPSLAVRTGAHLLPVFTVRQDDGSYLTVVEPPIDIVPGSHRQAVAAAATAYAARLEPHVRQTPSQWAGWTSGVLPVRGTII